MRLRHFLRRQPTLTQQEADCRGDAGCSSAGLDITCPLCGTHYSEAEGRACHVECPLHEHCGRLSCPYCAHEVPAPTRLTRWLSRWTAQRGLGKGA